MDHNSIENDAYSEGHGRQFAITSWAVKNRTTVIVITHNAAIAGMADRVVYLGDGKVQRIEPNARKLQPSELSW